MREKLNALNVLNGSKTSKANYKIRLIRGENHEQSEKNLNALKLLIWFIKNRAKRT